MKKVTLTDTLPRLKGWVLVSDATEQLLNQEGEAGVSRQGVHDMLSRGDLKAYRVGEDRRAVILIHEKTIESYNKKVRKRLEKEAAADSTD